MASFIFRGDYRIEAYSKPFSYFRGQPAWSIQVHNAFLLRLNWALASTTQEIKDKSKVVNSLNSAIKLEIEPSKGELEAERIYLQLEFDKDKASLSKFEVHPQYQELQKQANYLTEEIHALSNKNLMLQRKLTRYEKSIQSEQVPNESLVEQIYKEAGLYFGSALKKTLNEAKIFHIKLIQNRKDFLKVEIEAIKNQIQAIDAEVKILTSKRSEFMTTLQSHGALEEFTILQERLLEKKEHLEKIKFKITTIEETSLRKKEIKAAKIELETKLQRDYEQSRINWEKAIAIFSENSLALYNEPGNLIINLSENGYTFDVEIPRSNSEGVGKMKIFCYDLMLVDLFSRDGKINFLVHDSTMFDGVDSRQIARAIEHAHQKSIGRGFQYICVFNSNMLPEKDFDSNFKIDSFVRLTLKDQDPKDSLLGFRF